MTTKRINLDPLYCVICAQNPITKDTFPHYCDPCVEYLNKHGKFPDMKLSTERIDLEKEDEV